MVQFVYYMWKKLLFWFCRQYKYLQKKTKNKTLNHKCTFILDHIKSVYMYIHIFCDEEGFIIMRPGEKKPSQYRNFLFLKGNQHKKKK